MNFKPKVNHAFILLFLMYLLISPLYLYSEVAALVLVFAHIITFGYFILALIDSQNGIIKKSWIFLFFILLSFLFYIIFGLYFGWEEFRLS
jgi:hypothetical protein